MAYIGKEPIVGNFQKCDAITVVNGQAAYTLQVSSTNVVPESANHMLVSLNGILQAPVTSFTVSGSTLTFASNLATGDVIDFVILLGNVLDLGVPSDDTVGAAQIKNDLISGTTALASAPADTDEFLVSDAGTLKRIDYSLIKGGNTPYFYGKKASDQTTTRSVLTKLTGFTTDELDSDTAFDGTTFTVPSGKGGKYLIGATIEASFGSVGNDGERAVASIYTEGSAVSTVGAQNTGGDDILLTNTPTVILDLSATDTVEVYGATDDANASGTAISATTDSTFWGFKIG